MLGCRQPRLLPVPEAGHYLFIPFTVTDLGKTPPSSGGAAQASIWVQNLIPDSRNRSAPRFEGRQGLPRRGGSAAGGLRRALPQGAGAPVGSPGPMQEDSAPHPPRAPPSAHRRPQSPVPPPLEGWAEDSQRAGVLGAGEAGSPRKRRGCPPWASRRRDRERSARPHSGIPRFTWSGEGAGGSPDRAGGLEGAASALPHLGGSERPRVTAPHLASPPLVPTSLPGAGRRVGAGGGA